MNRYTIEYYYGTYSGTRVVYAEDGEQAIAKMWRGLRQYMTLGMASKSARIIDKIETEDEE